MTDDVAKDDRKRFIVWLGFLLLMLIVYCLVRSRQKREEAYEEYKKRQIVVVRGTVLNADCSFDPRSGIVTCNELLVTYPGPDGETANRAFHFEGHLESMDAVPQIGSSVLVSWNRKTPQNAYVMRIE